jgi:tetratricopeptide (TPR) repeat protein
VCTICLDTDPIQSGCACRGDAGLAHIQCRAMAAAHRMTNSDDCWAVCTTCGQAFTGAMRAGLAEAWWSMAQRLPAASLERAAAADNMAIALNYQHKFAEAEKMGRGTFAAWQRVLGREHPRTLSSALTLATALDGQDNFVEAEKILCDVLLVQRRVLGPDGSFVTAMKLASVLGRQGKHAEAEKGFREVLQIARRVLGPEHAFALSTADYLATALANQGKLAEAEQILCDVLPVQRRVLGPEHPQTLDTVRDLATVLANQGKHAEPLL